VTQTESPPPAIRPAGPVGCTNSIRLPESASLQGESSFRGACRRNAHTKRAAGLSADLRLSTQVRKRVRLGQSRAHAWPCVSGDHLAAKDPSVAVLLGAASFFGTFGDTAFLPHCLALLWCLRVRIRSEAPSCPAGRPARRCRSASPPCQSTEPSRPRPETAIVNGCCKRARPAKVARRCVPLSLSRATATSRPSQQTTCQESGSASADQATPS
jgi:hypothetical protein